MPPKFYEILCIIAAFQLIFFSFFLLTQKNIKRLSNKILVVFLLSKGIAIINIIFFYFVMPIYNSCPHLFYIGSSFSFLYAPALYFYTRSLVYSDFKFKKWHIVHLIPFITHSIFMTFKYHIYSADVKRELLAVGPLLNIYERVIIYGALDLLVLGYMVASLVTLLAYRRQIKNLYSSIFNINLSWLRFVLIGFIILYSLGFCNFIIWIISSTHNLFLSSIQTIGFFIFANVIVYKGLKQPEIFFGIEEQSKYKKSSFKKSVDEKSLKQLKNYMEIEKPFLEPAITLNELAGQVSIPARQLSQVINESFKRNFFDFINSYRIEEAKHYLLDRTNSNKTVLEVLYEVGFNSKSVFNSAFKKYTGMTPTEFKKFHNTASHN